METIDLSLDEILTLLGTRTAQLHAAQKEIRVLNERVAKAGHAATTNAAALEVASGELAALKAKLAGESPVIAGESPAV